MPSLNLKAHRFAYWGGNNVPVNMLFYCIICAYLMSSLLLQSQQNLFFLLFVCGFFACLTSLFQGHLLVWCLLFTEPSLKNVVMKGLRPCPYDLCVFEKRCFFGKKKLVKSSASTQLFVVKQKCINVQRNIMDQCLQLTQSVCSCSLSHYGEKHNNILLCWWYKE